MVAELIDASEQTCESLCQASWGRQEVWRAGWHCPLYQPCKAGALQRKSVFCIIVIVKYRETGDCTKPRTLDIPEYRESRNHSRIIVNPGTHSILSCVALVALVARTQTWASTLILQNGYSNFIHEQAPSDTRLREFDFDCKAALPTLLCQRPRQLQWCFST